MKIPPYPESEHKQMVDTVKNIRGKKIPNPEIDNYAARPETVDWEKTAKDLQYVYEKLKTRTINLELAIEPLADIADLWEENGLDESRPEWYSKGVRNLSKNWGEVELYCGRGGKRLLTLLDAFKAREALTGIAIPVLPNREIDGRCADLTKKYVTDGSDNIVHVTNCGCKL